MLYAVVSVPNFSNAFGYIAWYLMKQHIIQYVQYDKSTLSVLQ